MVWSSRRRVRNLGFIDSIHDPAKPLFEKQQQRQQQQQQQQKKKKTIPFI